MYRVLFCGCDLGSGVEAVELVALVVASSSAISANSSSLPGHRSISTSSIFLYPRDLNR